MRILRTLAIVAIALTLITPALARSSKKDVEELKTKVAELEATIAELKTTIAGLQAELGTVKSADARIRGLEGKIARLEAAQRRGGQAGRAANPEQEQAANKLLAEAQQLIQKSDYQGAQAKLAALSSQYGSTVAARRSQSIRTELAVFGKDAPEDFGIQKWLQGEVDLASGEPTVIVFWEVWCGYCRREVPKIESLYTKYKDQGLQVVGMTSLSKGKTEESVLAFMQEQNISYPIARESGTVRGHFAVRGIPAAAAIKDGKIVWRGHPSRITDELVASWL